MRVPLDGSEASKGELGAAAQRSKTPCAASDIRTFLIADHNSNEGIFIMFLISMLMRKTYYSKSKPMAAYMLTWSQ